MPGSRAGIRSTASPPRLRRSPESRSFLPRKLPPQFHRPHSACRWPNRPPPGTDRPASAAGNFSKSGGPNSQCRASVQSILGTGASRRSGIGQRVLDRHAHVGRRDLGNHAAIGVLDHGVHGGLRMNHHIHLATARNRTASRPRSPRSLCSSGGRIDGDAIPHLPGWMIQSLLPASPAPALPAGCSRNGPPEAVRISLRHLARGCRPAGTDARRCVRCPPESVRRRTPARPPSPACRRKPELPYSPARRACRARTAS